MIFEDERAAEADRFGFMLHLGDFIYEIVWYPEDRPQGMYDRRMRDIVRYPDGEKIRDFHIPTTVEGYRAVYRGYLQRPRFAGRTGALAVRQHVGQPRIQLAGLAIAAEFRTENAAGADAQSGGQPGILRISTRTHGEARARTSLERFDPPHVVDAPIAKFDDHGIGHEPNNLTAIASLHRLPRDSLGKQCGADRHRSAQLPLGGSRGHGMKRQPLLSDDFPEFTAEESLEILDAGRAYNGGNPPATIRFGDGGALPISRKTARRRRFSGADRSRGSWIGCANSKATWKIWGNTTATLDMRADPQNLAAGCRKPWPWRGVRGFSTATGHGTAYVERAEIYDFVRANGITGFATVAGDRHSFWAGYAGESLPPETFDAGGHRLRHRFDFRAGNSWKRLSTVCRRTIPCARFIWDRSRRRQPAAADYEFAAASRRSLVPGIRREAATSVRRARFPIRDVAPHVRFVDMGGHGYSVVRATSDAIETEFVCIPRPIERSATPDGGPLRYRARFRTPLWQNGEAPQMATQIVEGDPKFSV